MIKSFIYSLNGTYFRLSIRLFVLIVGLHFLEHIVQLFQLYILHWPRMRCLGLLGSIYPLLMTSEWLHYGHALFMLLGLAIFQLSPLAGRSWSLALWLAFYHHMEHAILLSQALQGVPMTLRHSLGSFLMPRIELHFVYNLMILIPMMVAMKKHPLREGA